MLRKIILAVLLALAAGCSNLAMTCQGTYTGDEVRNANR
jgi:hypothetical protein